MRRVIARMISLGALVACSAATAQAGSPVEQGALYDRPAKGSEHWDQKRTVVERGINRSIYNTSEPRYEVYLPDTGIATGAAVVMLPGGGMRLLGVGEQTDREIQGFLDHGVAVILLEYRTMQMPAAELERASAPPPGPTPIRFPKLAIVNANANPAKGDAAMTQLLQLAVADAQSALRMANNRAAEWSLDPTRIGIVGTSAGGGVGFGALLADAPPEAKPDFMISIFGPALQDVEAPQNAPPVYLITEADHGPVTDGLLALFSIWKDAGQRAELHIYEVPNFSMTIDLWGGRLFDWMREQAIIPGTAP